MRVQGLGVLGLKHPDTPHIMMSMMYVAPELRRNFPQSDFVRTAKKSPRRRNRRGYQLALPQGPLKILDQIPGVFQANRQTNGSFGDAHSAKLFLREPPL